MAEVVELRSEEMIPEFEQMEKLQLFDNVEIRKMMKKREDFEYKLQRVNKSKEHILRYIQYEMDLLKLIRLKQNEKGLAKKRLSVDYTIAKHIDRLYGYAIHRFSSEVQIWLSYIKFCKEVKLYSSGSRILEKLLQLHSDKPSLFTLAAQWEFDECQNIERARKYMCSGLHLHKNSKLLYRESFLLELNYAHKKRKEFISRKEPINEDDTIMNGGLANVIYNASVKQIKDVEMVVELLGCAEKYSFTEQLQLNILEDLKNRFPWHELKWDTLARRELMGLTKTEDNVKRPLNERIKNCAQMYEKAVASVNTERMWALYLDRMVELNKDPKANMPKLRRSCLTRAFQGAHNEGMMSEKYYLLWVEHCREEDNTSKLYEVLKGGTDKLPGSVTLWAARLRHQIKTGDEHLTELVFREALAGLGDSSLPIWKLMLQFCQNTNQTKVEELFKEGIMMTRGISNPLKPMYLEWLSLCRGIGAARKAYGEMVQLVPFCLEMHTKMAELEDMQPELNLKFTRQCHTYSCLQFGSKNTDVWMAHVKFEQTYGNPKAVTDIFNKAVKCLQPNLRDTFISEFSLSKAETFTTSQCLPKFGQPDETMETS